VVGLVRQVLRQSQLIRLRQQQQQRQPLVLLLLPQQATAAGRASSSSSDRSRRRSQLHAYLNKQCCHLLVLVNQPTQHGSSNLAWQPWLLLLVVSAPSQTEHRLLQLLTEQLL
jgi:hypothetical protein